MSRKIDSSPNSIGGPTFGSKPDVGFQCNLFLFRFSWDIKSKRNDILDGILDYEIRVSD